MGRMVDRTHRELTDEDIARIVDTCSTWRDAQTYADVPGFCKSAPISVLRQHGHVLMPGRYVGGAPKPEDDEPFDAKMQRLAKELHALQAKGTRLEAIIAKNLRTLGFRPTGSADENR